MDDNPVIGGLTGRLQKPKLAALISSMQLPAESVRKAIKGVLSCINIDDSTGAGLDLIGDIIGQPRVLADVVHLQFFGYKGQANSRGYGQARYRQPGESSIGGTTTLADEEYRRILRWRKDYIKSSGTINDIKTALKHVFGAAPSVKQTGNAEVTIFLPDNATQSPYADIVRRFVPYPAGVSVKIMLNGKELE